MDVSENDLKTIVAIASRGRRTNPMLALILDQAAQLAELEMWATNKLKEGTLTSNISALAEDAEANGRVQVQNVNA